VAAETDHRNEIQRNPFRTANQGYRRLEPDFTAVLTRGRFKSTGFRNVTEEEYNMEKSEVQQRVKKVVAKVLHLEVAEVADDANFIFDLGADSTQSLELVAAFEEEFDIEMDEDKALGIQTVADAVNFIGSYLE